MFNWLKNLFLSSAAPEQTNAGTPQTKVQVEMPPVKPPAPQPELSCFVKGIIKSLETEPEKWRVNTCSNEPMHTHIDHDVTISLWTHYSNLDRLYLADGLADTLLQIEKSAILRAYEQTLAKQWIEERDKKNQIAKREKEARDAALRTAFESLGCPTATTEQKPAESLSTSTK